MTPGPHEPDADMLQNYLAHVVDDLLKLYDEGILFRTATGKFFLAFLSLKNRLILLFSIRPGPKSTRRSYGCGLRPSRHV